MQYLVVNSTRYEAVAKPELGIKDAEQLLKDIGANAKLTPMPESDFETIVSDLVWEKSEFATWAALAKEIEIRRVGYAVETTLRSMLKANATKDEAYQEAKKGMEELEVELREMSESSSPKDTDIARIREDLETAKRNVEAFDTKILRWSSNTFPNYSHRDKQMMQWWLGLRREDPTLANCWECALMALVKTTFFKIPKEYMVWCVEQISTPIYMDFDPKTPKSVLISRLYSAAVSCMDYYFPRYGVPVIDATKERYRPADDSTECYQLPLDVVIPRGRLLIFDYLGHVAISTGELRPITSAMGRDAWARTTGHGVIDLNAKGQTLRERTIEDFAVPGNCNNQLIVAPFPICALTKTIAMKGSIPPTKEEVEAYQRSLDTAATEAFDSKVRQLEEQRDRALKRRGADPNRINKSHQAAVSDARVKFQNAVVKAAKKLNKKITFMSEITPNPKEENLELRYGPVDPYGGKVTF